MLVKMSFAVGFYTSENALYIFHKFVYIINVLESNSVEGSRMGWMGRGKHNGLSRRSPLFPSHVKPDIDVHLFIT